MDREDLIGDLLGTVRESWRLWVPVLSYVLPESRPTPRVILISWTGKFDAIIYLGVTERSSLLPGNIVSHRICDRDGALHPPSSYHEYSESLLPIRNSHTPPQSGSVRYVKPVCDYTYSYSPGNSQQNVATELTPIRSIRSFESIGPITHSQSEPNCFSRNVENEDGRGALCMRRAELAEDAG